MLCSDLFFTRNKYALDNLIACIKSINSGIKRSAIYFAGKYRIKVSENVLRDELKKEEETCIKILIALVLYELGNYDGVMYLQGSSDLLHTNSSGRMAGRRNPDSDPRSNSRSIRMEYDRWL